MSNLKQQERMPFITLPQHLRFSLKKSQVDTFIKDQCNLMVKQITCRFVARNSKETRIKRKEWVEKWSQTDMSHLSNCVFVDVSALNINIRSFTTSSAKGTLAIVTTPSARAVSHTILGAILAINAVNIEIELPNLKPKKIKVDGSHKRK